MSDIVRVKQTNLPRVRSPHEHTRRRRSPPSSWKHKSMRLGCRSVGTYNDLLRFAKHSALYNIRETNARHDLMLHLKRYLKFVLASLLRISGFFAIEATAASFDRSNPISGTASSSTMTRNSTSTTRRESAAVDPFEAAAADPSSCSCISSNFHRLHPFLEARQRRLFRSLCTTRHQRACSEAAVVGRCH